jgi:hypothetical protein
VGRGWDEGMLEVATGETATLTIQPEWGYGYKGHPEAGIPKNAVVAPAPASQFNPSRLSSFARSVGCSAAPALPCFLHDCDRAAALISGRARDVTADLRR